MAFAYQLVQVVYWLSLSTWFGGVLFIAMAVPIVARTVKEADDAPGLEEDQGILLAGSVVANLFSSLVKIELLCAVLLLIVIIAQWFLIDLHNGPNLFSAFIRSALFLATAIMVVYDWRVLQPRTRRLRDELIASVNTPEELDPARERFARHHDETYTLLAIQGFLLLGMIMFSATMFISFTIPHGN